MSGMLDEQALLAGARRYEEQALAEIYDRYSPGLYRYSVRLLGDPDIAEDCVAETYSRLLRALRSGGGPKEYLRAYLYRVAHNWIIDYRRKEATFEDRPLENVPADGADESPSDIFQGEIDRQAVREALFRLTPDQRQVIMLKYFEGLSNQEVAAAVDKTIGAVKSLQNRGLASLKRLMTVQENTP